MALTTNIFPPSKKIINLFASIILIALIVIAILMEIFLELKPCATCLIQRVIFAILALLFLIASVTFKYKKTYFTMHSMISGLSLTGMILAIRQSYFQLYPDPLATCGIPFEYVLNSYPVLDIIKHIFNNSNNCQEVQWMLFGLSLPMWTIFCFLFFLVLSIYLIKNKAQKEPKLTTLSE